MTSKIIALIDGSIYSHSVCDHAAWVAARTGWTVELMHVLGRRDGVEKSDLSGAIALGARSTLLADLAELDAQRARLITQRGRAILEDGRAILDKAGITDITTRLRHGDLMDTVAEQETSAEMVLIGKRGEAADFAKGHLGSNLERIVRSSRKPVLVASRAFKPITRVLVAYDGAESSTRAVDHVARSPLYAGLAVHIVTVGTPIPEKQSRLKNVQAVLQDAGLKTTTDIVAGPADKALSNLVNHDGYDLLVMGAYGHSRIRRLIIGSTTTEMIRSCKVPVVLIR